MDHRTNEQTNKQTNIHTNRKYNVGVSGCMYIVGVYFLSKRRHCGSNLVSVRTGLTLWGYCMFYTVSLEIMIGYITPTTPPPTYNAIPHSGEFWSTMQIYSHNIILYVYLLPQCTSCRLTPTNKQTNKK